MQKFPRDFEKIKDWTYTEGVTEGIEAALTQFFHSISQRREDIDS
jgi:hypothetical protein